MIYTCISLVLPSHAMNANKKLCTWGKLRHMGGFFRIRSFRCWTLLKEAKFEFPPVPLSR